MVRGGRALSACRGLIFVASIGAWMAAMCASAAGADATAEWETYWFDHGVSPAPPRDFLASRSAPKIHNLTEGKISDATAEKWVMADVRRTEGDSWSLNHLRLDLIDADVLGPPGLNGSAEAVQDERQKGVVELRFPKPSEIVAAGVLAISKPEQAAHSTLGLTDFVIVLVVRASGADGERVFADGRKEVIPAARPAGALSRQLDTGYFREHKTIGPLWYQAGGWNCTERDGTLSSQLCAKVQ